MLSLFTVSSIVSVHQTFRKHFRSIISPHLLSPSSVSLHPYPYVSIRCLGALASSQALLTTSHVSARQNALCRLWARQPRETRRPRSMRHCRRRSLCLHGPQLDVDQRGRAMLILLPTSSGAQPSTRSHGKHSGGSIHERCSASNDEWGRVSDDEQWVQPSSRTSTRPHGKHRGESIHERCFASYDEWRWVSDDEQWVRPKKEVPKCQSPRDVER